MLFQSQSSLGLAPPASSSSTAATPTQLGGGGTAGGGPGTPHYPTPTSEHRASSLSSEEGGQVIATFLSLSVHTINSFFY